MQVCGRHFSDYHFAGGAHAKVRRLKTSIAVPTLFLPRRPLDRIPTDKQKKETEERAERLNRRQCRSSDMSTEALEMRKSVENDAPVVMHEQSCCSNDADDSISDEEMTKNDEERENINPEVEAANVLMELQFAALNASAETKIMLEKGSTVIKSVTGNKVTLSSLIKSDEDLVAFTGIQLSLLSAIYWSQKDEILQNMPKCFAEFKQTRLVLDCTEIFVERPTCLKCRLRLYSHYKGSETIKLLLGVTPSGLISFLSEVYGGRASDKAIFNQIELLSRLIPNVDAIIVDKGFLIDVECAEHHIELIVPPRLGKNKQLSEENVVKTRKIAAARVHVKRAIQRIKLFRILKSKLSWSMVGHIDKTCTIIVALVNLRGMDSVKA
ncbi:PREDICTED: uncharacterized protein LOC108777145 [Cyphomyrmex costatus]|uniref:uncharacterized protein LOC108777145 n=1 Tax=Cyphomyrmex costatus TaxID=456900 RepID=UPI000852231C|nr:PREDICTED: uncharacterized protein LOC108777145 [Cyphomyrmex costatus]